MYILSCLDRKVALSIITHTLAQCKTITAGHTTHYNKNNC